MSRRSGDAEEEDARALEAVETALRPDLQLTGDSRRRAICLKSTLTEEARQRAAQAKKRQDHERTKRIKELQQANREALAQGNGHRVEAQMREASWEEGKTCWLEPSDTTMRACANFLQGVDEE